jgi:hypothetical protein
MRVLLDVFGFFENLDLLKDRALALQDDIGQLGDTQGVIVATKYVEERQNVPASILHAINS